MRKLERGLLAKSMVGYLAEIERVRSALPALDKLSSIQASANRLRFLTEVISDHYQKLRSVLVDEVHEMTLAEVKKYLKFLDWELGGPPFWLSTGNVPQMSYEALVTCIFGSEPSASLSESEKAGLEAALNSLTKQEAAVLRLRFSGRTVNQCCTVGKEDDPSTPITKSEVAKIAARALRRLRHPTRVRMIQEHFAGESPS
jgi:hypothetical protein